MSFPFDLYLPVFVLSGVAAAIAVPVWRRWCLRTGLLDDPGHRKIHFTPVPLAGGLAVMTGIAAPILLGLAALQFGWLPQSAESIIAYGWHRRAPQLTAIVVGALAMLILGWADDRHELRPAVKFIWQALIASLVAAVGVRVTLFVPSVLFSFVVTVLWVLTLTNALNFMDNMNGLCAGLGAIGSGWFALSAAMQGQYLVVLLALSCFGALIGFLPWNFPRARVFLGDSGSHLTGYLLAVLAILPNFYSDQGTDPGPWMVLKPLLILFIPLFDLVWVVILRWRIGQPFYVGDNNHLSHRLVRRGFSRTRAVLVIWLMAAIFGALAFVR